MVSSIVVISTGDPPIPSHFGMEFNTVTEWTSHSCNALHWTQSHCYRLLNKLPKLSLTTLYVCKVVYNTNWWCMFKTNWWFIKSNLQIVSPGCFSMHCKCREPHIGAIYSGKAQWLWPKTIAERIAAKILFAANLLVLQKYFSHREQ